MSWWEVHLEIVTEKIEAEIWHSEFNRELMNNDCLWNTWWKMYIHVYVPTYFAAMTSQRCECIYGRYTPQRAFF